MQVEWGDVALLRLEVSKDCICVSEYVFGADEAFEGSMNSGDSYLSGKGS